MVRFNFCSNMPEAEHCSSKIVDFTKKYVVEMVEKWTVTLLFFYFGPKFLKSLIVPVPGGHEYEKSAHKTLEPFFELNHNLWRHCSETTV